ncbi:MAG: conditioned medium-induced protein 4 [Halolamina sp.]
MDDKTEELRDIFVETTGSDTVTEDQADARGDLTDETDDSVDRRLADVVATMREQYDFETDLDDESLARLVRLVHESDGADDEAIADELDVAASTVFDARMDLHLVADRDRDAPIDFERLRSLVVDDAPPAELTDEFDVDEDTVAHYSAVARADLEATCANDRFRDEFADLLGDADLERRHAESAREDGLQEATEDIESGVSF